MSMILTLVTCFLALSEGWVASSRGRVPTSRWSTTEADQLGSTTVSKDHYDVVTVDLSDGRDYPIYIGTGYSDEEGMIHRGA